MELQVLEYIQVEDDEILLDELPEEEQKRLAELLQESIMEAAGYKRYPA